LRTSLSQIRELGVRAVLPDEPVDLAPLVWFADDTQERATEVGHERDSSTRSGSS
jgi:hypothetical protein